MNFEDGRVDELRNKDFYVLNTTDHRPDIPESITDYEFHILNYAQVGAGNIYIYMTMDRLRELISSKELESVIGTHPTDTVVSSYLEEKELETSIYFEADQDFSEEELQRSIVPVFEKNGLNRITENEGEDDTWYYTTKSRIDRKTRVSLRGKLKISIYYCIVMLFVLFGFTDFFQFFFMDQKRRCREYILLEALGMEADRMKRIALIKYLIFTIATILGGMLSGVCLSLAQFHEAGRYQAIEGRIPYGVFGIEAICVVLFFAGMYLVETRSIKENDLTYWLKND